MAYNPPAFKNEITLQLSRNESSCPIKDLPSELADQAGLVPRYPDHLAVQQAIGDWIGIEGDRIVVTAGGDDAIDRIMRTSITSDRPNVVCHAPSFEMFAVYAKNYQGTLVETTWQSGDFPIDEFCSRIDDTTAVAVVVSPNNPTGGTISTDAINKISQVAAQNNVRLLVDNAYIEFADEDPTAELAKTPNVSMVRTFSKAWGLAGLRIGYLIAADADYATEIRDTSGPFPVSCLSLETARRGIEQFLPAMQQNVDTVKQLRAVLEAVVADCGLSSVPSGGNFLLISFDDAKIDADTAWQRLGEAGIGVRKFPGAELLKNQLRITIPTNVTDYLQLATGFCSATDSNPEIAKMALLSSGSSIADVPSGESVEFASGSRVADSNRTTKETKIDIELDLDGTGKIEISTGIGFMDHMLTALAFHSGMDLKLICDGDLHIDDHHTAEDCALALGSAIDAALGPRKGIKRFGYAYAPLDEALARTVIDLSGRPWPEIHLDLQREMVGTWACENITHFFQSLAMTLKCSLHVDVIRGDNDHHKAEAAFKSLAKALGQALTRTAGEVPSTKGVL